MSSYRAIARSGQWRQSGFQKLPVAGQQRNLFDNACCGDDFIHWIRTKIERGALARNLNAYGEDGDLFQKCLEVPRRCGCSD
jgi:hypothetical protein